MKYATILIFFVFLFPHQPRLASCNQAGDQKTSPVDGMTQQCVPAGEFLMGAKQSDPAALDNEKPLHTVYLDAYWIDRNEVTNAMFSLCVAAGACHQRTYSPYQWGVSSRTRPDYFENPAYGNYPVIMLDREEARAYCRWAGRDLPSEAQWEKASRGAGDTIFPWGNDIDCTRANFGDCEKDTSAVDAHPLGASVYGVLDVAGNLAEWTADWYDAGYYQNSPRYNPRGPQTGEYGVLRGGSWGAFVNSQRVSSRVNGKPEHWHDGRIGFRCAENNIL